MIRLALAQALLPEASITLKAKNGRFTHTPDLTYQGRLMWLLFACACLVAAGLALRLD